MENTAADRVQMPDILQTDHNMQLLNRWRIEISRTRTSFFFSEEMLKALNTYTLIQ